MRETQNCRALKSQILRKGAGNPSKILPPNSLRAQFVPTVQNFASDLNKTRNQFTVFLQVLALELPDVVWAHFPQWFRTLPNHGFPSEQIVRMALQHLQPIVLAKHRPNLLLPKLLAARIRPPEPQQQMASAA